ncbi:MAG TPA: LCP family protein, partial [Candidatus Sulfotelmatobacter sp.]|nr:LCP family protein [Candidatus Sulfotelmatobacter sp.]
VFRIGITRKPTTILLVGTDLNFSADSGKALQGSDGRTDTILLLRIDPVSYRVNALSIPRDSFVNVPGYGYQKINAAHVFGGIALTERTIEELTGKHIDYYLEINPYEVIKLIDLLGGIDLYVEKDMYYVDNAQHLNINLKQGRQKLSGLQAQDYLRFRHDAAGDLGRIERQQKLLRTLMVALAQPANILKAPVALKIALGSIKTDLSFANIIRLANFARLLAPDEIRSFTPSAESGTSPYAGSILYLNRASLDEILKDRF